MTALPDLRIVAIDSIIDHEFNDTQRTAPLVERLKVEGILKNPPIVTPLGGGDPRFVVLDGANRSTALQALGYSHVVVHVVHYYPPHVTLSTWHHAVTGLDLERFTADIHAIPGLSLAPMDLLHARAGLARREFIVYIIRADGVVLAAQTESRQLHEQNRLLNAMVDTYKLTSTLHRTISDDLQEMEALYSDLTALVVFPNYEAAEVLALARDGELLPPGLTRHLIQGRVLRLNYPLSELAAPDSLEAKNARLRDWIEARAAERAIRFYGESTFLFDE